MYCKYISATFSFVIIAIAVILAVLPSISPDRIDYVATVLRFFDIMLPVLAVGALIKYLCKCSNNGKGCSKEQGRNDK